MSIFDFRDILNDFIYSISEDKELTRKICKIAKRNDKKLILAF